VVRGEVLDECDVNITLIVGAVDIMIISQFDTSRSLPSSSPPLSCYTLMIHSRSMSRTAMGVIPPGDYRASVSWSIMTLD
jgi:hypothetical protein